MIRYPLYVTIDTNIFDSTGYDLGDDGTLGHLYSDNFVIGIEMGHLIDKVNRNVLAEKAKANLDAFIEKLNVEIMDSSQVDVEQIFDDYFSYAAPFENNEKKRKEFPDVLLQHRLENDFQIVI